MKPVLALFLAAFLAVPAFAADLPRSSPEAQGVSSAGVLAFVTEADQKVAVMNSFMLVRHGHVVAEGWWGPYDAKSRHELYSLSKSFTSTAVGLAIAEGKLSLDDPVLKFFPDQAPANPSNNLKQMRLHDLLRMSAGHQAEVGLAASKDPWTKAFLSHAVPFKPGTHFLYNTPGTYMASAMVQKATGQTVLDYLKPRLFDPLGIENPTWGMSPQGISLGGYGLSVRTEDIAKFGQLYLQKGKWGDKQLVPAAWVAAATSRQTSNGSNPASDWEQGYGYQFWRCRHNAFRGDGAHGQFCVVMPELDAVVAITAGTRDLQGVLNVVWDKLLPAMKTEPFQADETAAKALKKKKLARADDPDAAKGDPCRQTATGPTKVRCTPSHLTIRRSNRSVLILRPVDPPCCSVRSTARLARGLPAVEAFGRKVVRRSAARPNSRLRRAGTGTADNIYSLKICPLRDAVPGDAHPRIFQPRTR